MKSPKQGSVGRGGNIGMRRPEGGKPGGHVRSANSESRDEYRTSMSEAIKVWFRANMGWHVFYPNKEDKRKRFF